MEFVIILSHGSQPTHIVVPVNITIALKGKNHNIHPTYALYLWLPIMGPFIIHNDQRRVGKYNDQQEGP